MNDYGEWTPEALGWQMPPPAPRRQRNGRRWLLVAVLALAFALTLGIGAMFGSNIIGAAQAASISPGGATSSQSLPGGPGAAGSFQTLAGTPGASPPGQCSVLTVSSVSGNTIVAKAPDGSTVTIHTTASTVYTRAGQTATASSVTVGSHIAVQGTHNSDGSITATRIDIR